MKKKHIKIASFIIQSVYCAACIFDVVLCLVYRSNFETSLGSDCARWALDLTGALFFVPAMPVSLILNILAMPSGQAEQMRKRWQVWTLFSPVVYALFYFVAVCIFIATTGGI